MNSWFMIRRFYNEKFTDAMQLQLQAVPCYCAAIAINLKKKKKEAPRCKTVVVHIMQEESKSTQLASQPACASGRQMGTCCILKF